MNDTTSGSQNPPSLPITGRSRRIRLTGRCYPAEDGVSVLTGAPPNELTSSDARDRFAGTPWHKPVPARVEAV